MLLPGLLWCVFHNRTQNDEITTPLKGKQLLYILRSLIEFPMPNYQHHLFILHVSFRIMLTDDWQAIELACFLYNVFL
jgi:hypothetical protein